LPQGNHFPQLLLPAEMRAAGCGLSYWKRKWFCRTEALEWAKENASRHLIMISAGGRTPHQVFCGPKSMGYQTKLMKPQAHQLVRSLWQSGRLWDLEFES
jgi:hypothetical protein